MLTLAPLKNKAEVEAIFKAKNIPFNEFSGVVTANDGTCVIGMSLYELTNDKMTVFYIEPVSDIPLADGILRSTLHIAAERSIMSAYYAEPMDVSFLKKVDFIKKEEEKSLQIDKLFKSCCSCK